MPEKTKAKIRQDGFFITDDLGRIDAAGYVHIVGRGKDVIITGEFNVYSRKSAALSRIVAAIFNRSGPTALTHSMNPSARDSIERAKRQTFKTIKNTANFDLTFFMQAI